MFISGTKSECRKVLETVLKNRRLCSLLSPFFTPNAAPAEFIQLYEKVVKFLSEDNSDMIFMLLTKVRCGPVLTLPLECRNRACSRSVDIEALGARFPGGPEAPRPCCRLRGLYAAGPTAPSRVGFSCVVWGRLIPLEKGPTSRTLLES